ncbi:MAG TPA: lysylphosphatidylglycerol synthase transmembrane domain-containing protein [Spirochaetia bacterium]|nr:lysylphosphatidylglycerol synthase transmembrane domain-containing protein [Spirochaetia bacterium]
MIRRLSRPLRITIEVVLIGGLIALFILILDPERLREEFLRLTVASVLGLLGLQVALHTVGMLQWWVLLREAGIHASPWRVFRARLSGCAITSLTPSAYFGGEPVRAALLKDSATPYRRVFATVAVDKYIELATKLPAAAVGLGFLIFRVHPSLALVVVSSLFVAGFLVVFLLLMVKLFQGGDFIVALTRRVVRPLARLRPRAAAKAVHVVRDFKGSVAALITTRRVFYLALGLGLTLSAVELAQYAYALAVLGVPSIPNAAIIFFGHMFLGIFSFIPGNVGSMEGVFLFTFTLLGLGSNRSLIFSLLIRVGQMVMVALGLLNIVVSRLTNRARKEGAEGADRIRTGA